MIHIISTVSSIINFRNPCKDFECFVARFYLAQFLMNDCTISGLFHARMLIWWLGLYERGPNEQKVYETHLTNVPAGRFLPCAEWTLLHEPTSRKSALSVFEQQRLGPYSCVLNIIFSTHLRLAKSMCRNSWRRCTRHIKLPGPWSHLLNWCTAPICQVPSRAVVTGLQEAVLSLPWPLCDHETDTARTAEGVRQTSSLEVVNYEIDIYPVWKHSIPNLKIQNRMQLYEWAPIWHHNIKIPIWSHHD